MILLVSAALAVSCVDTPRDGSVIESYQVNLSGYSTYPDDLMALSQWDWTSNSFFDLAHGAVTSTSGTYENETGSTWYYFSATRSISDQLSFWRNAPANDGQRRVESVIRAYDTKWGFDAYTYRVDADACFGSKTSSIDIISSCASPNSPDASVFLNCGKRSQLCCKAHDVPESQYCDTGNLCDGRYCSIPAGGSGQRCNVNGDQCKSGLECIASTCRNTKIEKLPLLTLELRVKTCNDSSWVNYFNGSGFSVMLNDNTFWVEVPGNELRPGTTNTFGLRIPGIGRLGDVRQLSVILNNAKWCVDRVELLANSRVVYSKTFSPSFYDNSQWPNPYHPAISISRDELRTHWTQLDPTTFCASPSTISGAAFQRMITGVIGNTLVTSTDFSGGDFDSGGFVRNSRLDSTTIKTNAKYKVTVNKAGFIFDMKQEISFTLRPTCSTNTRSVSIAMSPISVVSLEGDVAYDILNGASAGLVGVIATVQSYAMINDNLHSFRTQLQNLVNKLPACPTFGVDAASPPNITIWPSGFDMCAE
jgi:hypothetical protein